MITKTRFFAAGLACIAALVLLQGCALTGAREGGITISVSVSRTHATIGDIIRYTITARAPRGVTVGRPACEDGRLGVFEIRSTGSRRAKALFGSTVETIWFDIVTFEPGERAVPPIAVPYRRAGEESWLTAETRPLPVTIRSVLPAGARIEDIKDIKGPLAYFQVNWPAVFAAGAGLLVLAAGIAWWIRRLRRVPVKLPHETALEELEALRAFLARSGEVKEFFVRISDCIRAYIERAFLLKAPEMTTEEFLNSVKGAPALGLEQKDLLKDFLRACDLVKFAKYRPSPVEIDRLLEAARHFVEETRPRPEKP